MIVGCTKLYSHREETDTSFQIANETFQLFLGNKLPNRKMYWKGPPDTFVSMSYSMTGDICERILQNLYLCRNEQLDK